MSASNPDLESPDETAAPEAEAAELSPVADDNADDLLLGGSFDAVESVIGDVENALAALVGDVGHAGGTDSAAPVASADDLPDEPAIDMDGEAEGDTLSAAVPESPDAVPAPEGVTAPIPSPVPDPAAPSDELDSAADPRPANVEATDAPPDPDDADPRGEAFDDVLDSLDEMIADQETAASPPSAPSAPAPEPEASDGEASAASATTPAELDAAQAEMLGSVFAPPEEIAGDDPAADAGEHSAATTLREAPVLDRSPFAEGMHVETTQASRDELADDPLHAAIEPSASADSDDQFEVDHGSPETVTVELPGWVMTVGQALEPLSIPMKFVPESMRLLVNVIAITLAAWVPIVWVFVLLRT